MQIFISEFYPFIYYQLMRNMQTLSAFQNKEKTLTKSSIKVFSMQSRMFATMWLTISWSLFSDSAGCPRSYRPALQNTIQVQPTRSSCDLINATEFVIETEESYRAAVSERPSVSLCSELSQNVHGVFPA